MRKNHVPHTASRAEFFSSLLERADLLLWRGSSHRSMGEFEAAMADFAQAATLRPNWADPLVERAYAFSSMGDLDAAVAEVARARALDPKSSYAVIESMNILPDAGRWQDCLALTDDALRLAPDDPLTFAYTSQCQHDGGQFETTLYYYRRALSMGLQEAFLRANIAVVLLDLGRPAVALEEARAAVALDPTHGFSQQVLVEALIANGDINGALAAWRAAGPQVADGREILTNKIAWGLFEAGRAPEGLEIMEGWLTSSPEPIAGADVADTYAHLLAAAGRPEEATKAFLKAVDLGGPARRALYMAGLARLGFPTADLAGSLGACAVTGGACRLTD